MHTFLENFCFGMKSYKKGNVAFFNSSYSIMEWFNQIIEIHKIALKRHSFHDEGYLLLASNQLN